jgi:hypothetical protein
MAHFLSSSLEENDMAIPYYHVDAFTDELFAGLSVCALDWVTGEMVFFAS